MKRLGVGYRGILVYNICLISVRNSVSDGATNQFWILPGVNIHLTSFLLYAKPYADEPKCKHRRQHQSPYWPVGYLQIVEELNLGPPNKNPSSGMVEDLKPGPPDYKFSALTTRPRCLLYVIFTAIVAIFCYVCVSTYRKTLQSLSLEPKHRFCITCQRTTQALKRW